MRALGFRIGRWWRSRARSTMLLTIVIAAVAAIVLAMAAGARRTSTAPDRYTEMVGLGADASGIQDGGRSRAAEIADLPGAAFVESMSFVYGGISSLDTGEFFDSIVFSGSYRSGSGHLVAGRDPDPARPNEFVATASLAESGGLSIGDTVQLLALTQDDAAAFGYDPTYAEPVLEGVLVGVIESAASLDDPSDMVVFSPALIEDESIGISGTVMTIGLEDGVSLEDFQAQLDTLPEAERITLGPATVVSADTRTAVRGQTVGLWVLAGIGAAVAVAALGQVLARNVRLGPDEVGSLASLGYSRPQIVGESAARAAVPVVAGVTVGVGLSIAVSSVFPFGFVRRIEPDPGLRIEATTLALGWLLLVVGLLGWVALAARARPAKAAQRLSTANAVASRCPTPAMATGVRFAFSSRARSASWAASIGGDALVVAALVGTLTFAVSARRLVEEPVRYGSNFDVLFDDGSEEISPQLLAILETDRDVQAVTLYTASQARVAGTTIALAGMDRFRGNVGPYVVSGDLPVTAEEAAIGRRSARELDLAVGDDLSLSNDTGTFVYTITAVVVPPGIRGNDIVGHGAIVTEEGFARLEPEAPPNAAAIVLRPGAPGDTAARIAAAAGEFLGNEEETTRPPAILSVARITFVPFVLAGLLAALGTLVVVNVLYTGVRRRDSQVAVLRSLGAAPRWLVHAVCWQAVVSTLVPALIGAPVGFVAGRLVFVAFAARLGAVDDAAAPFGLAAAAIGILVVVGIGAAMIAGRSARRNPPAMMLRAG